MQNGCRRDPGNSPSNLAVCCITYLLGHCETVRGNKLCLLLHVLIREGTFTLYAQEKKENETEAFNELVQGVLTFSVREAYSDMPDELPEGEGSGGQVELRSCRRNNIVGSVADMLKSWASTTLTIVKRR